MSRPAVSMVVPFLGSPAEAAELVRRLGRLRLTGSDELIVADNCELATVVAPEGSRVQVVAAGGKRSASYARNAGAAVAAGEWLLFCDADCLAPADLLDAYFADPPGDRDGVVAGEVEGDPAQTALLARWARSRRGRWVEHHLDWGPLPSGITANLLVRSAAFTELGGFRPGGGGDVDLSWRAQRAGWGFAYRPVAIVRHRDRERLRELADQAIAYGGHQRRLRDLHGATVPRPPLLAPVVRGSGGALAWALRGEGERARFSLIDALWAKLVWWGWLRRGAGARRAD